MGHGIDTPSATLVDVLRKRAALFPDNVAYTFLQDGEGAATHVTYGVLHRRACVIARELVAELEVGARAVLLYPSGLDFIAAFFGCLYAGVVAVPAVPLDPFAGDAGVARLAAVVEDADASCVLAGREWSEVGERFRALAPRCGERPWRVAALESDQNAPEFERRIAPDHLAFLQYTSGSTGAPRGVMVSHANLAAHGAACHRALGGRDDDVVVSWLPLYHDMGLIGTIVFPMQAGYRVVLMSPASFLRRPFRWVQAISEYAGTLSVAPNFGYELCARKTSAAEVTTLDLRAWTLALNGAERVRPDTVDRFARKFAPAGFRAEAFAPCYGLAEATLMVSVAVTDVGCERVTLDADALRRGIIACGAEGDTKVTLASCGAPIDGQCVVIVDPETLAPVPPGTLGEIWVSGACVARGYWRRAEDSAAELHAHPRDGSESGYLRTGDLGFFDGGRLIVVGRRKDVIIVRGVNHMPEDIEVTAAESHPALRPGGGAAFGVDDGSGEALVLVHEVREPVMDPEPIVAAVTAAVVAAHGVRVARMVLVKPRSIPKTSSGKVRRRACREMYLQRVLDVVATWEARPPAGECSSGGSAGLEFDRRRCIEEWLTAHVAALRDLPSDQIDVTRPFSAYGVDSAEAAVLAVELEDWLQTTLPTQLVWNRPTIAGLAEALVDLLTSSAPTSPLA